MIFMVVAFVVVVAFMTCRIHFGIQAMVGLIDETRAQSVVVAVTTADVVIALFVE